MRVENKRDAGIARQPRKREQVAARGFKVRNVFVAQKVERIPQRRSPILIPPRLASGYATTITNPTPYAVLTTPRSALAVQPFVDLHIVPGRMLIEILAIVRYSETACRSFDGECVCETQIAELKVMPVGLAVGGEI